MRRLLAVAVAAGLPALASAQTFPPAGQLRTVSFDALNGGSLIGIAQCNGTSGLDVTWTLAATGTSGVASGQGTVRIFASDKQRSVSNDSRQCWLSSDTLPDQTIKTAQLAQFDSIAMQQNRQTIPASGFAALASAWSLNCSAGSSATIYLCAIPYQNASTTTPLGGVANGAFVLDTTKPNPVTGVSAASSDQALVISFAESTSGTNPTSFRGEAVRTDKTDLTVHTGTSNASPVTVDGLTNDVEYTVRVIAISAAGNESDPFPGPNDTQVTGTPRPSLDFWEWYRQHPGAVEQGGCATGAAGALALLGAAALLRVRRRKP